MESRGSSENPGRLNQTDRDHLELASTEVTPATAKFLSLAFALMLFMVPIAQAVVEIGRSHPPQVLDVFRPFVAGIKSAAAGDWTGLQTEWRSGVRPETLHAYETTLEDVSLFQRFFQPRLQQALTAFLGVGNENVVLGRDGWIFYKAGLDYVARPSVIDRASIEQTSRKMVDKGVDPSPQPDPRPALLQLDRDCRNAGIHLVVMPVPDKVMLQPTHLYQRARGPQEVPVGNNAGYAELVEEMRARGVDWFDSWPRSVRATDIRYLTQDTHWTPEFMDAVATELARHINETPALARQTGRPLASAAAPMQIVEERVSRVGDLVDMLKLPAQQSIFAPQTVTIQRVIDGQLGRPIEPKPDADVLLLGDSFTNIYSRGEMGWGSAGGFGEHLAYHLGRRIDVIALNGGAATQVREELARQDNAERLGWKKVIVYEFAIRNLLGENWKPLRMATPKPPVSESTSSEIALGPVSILPPAPIPTKPTGIGRGTVGTGGQLVVSGTIIQTSRVPAPGTAPYKDCLTFIKIRVESVPTGTYGGAEMIVALWAMKDDAWLPGARYALGDRLRLSVIPFSQAGDDIRSMQRADDTDDFSLRPYFSLRENRE